MSKYDELRDAARKARDDWFQYRDRCLRYVSTVVHGLISYGGVPDDCITFLRWDQDARAYAEAEGGKNFTLFGAMEHDDEDGYWHLGICISLTPARKVPSQWLSFGLCVSEREGKPVFRLGRVGSLRPLDLNDPAECNKFVDEIVEEARKALSEPRKPSNKIGFDVLK